MKKVFKTLLAALVSGAAPAVVEAARGGDTPDARLLLTAAVTGMVMYLLKSPRSK